MAAVVKQTVIPADPNDLICDTCPERFAWKGDMLRTFESARVKGWHIYHEVLARYHKDTGQREIETITKTLCPSCVGTPRSKLPPPPVVLEGQADILEDLAIEVTPVEKEKKQPKRGIN